MLPQNVYTYTEHPKLWLPKPHAHCMQTPTIAYQQLPILSTMHPNGGETTAMRKTSV